MEIRFCSPFKIISSRDLWTFLHSAVMTLQNRSTYLIPEIACLSKEKVQTKVFKIASFYVLYHYLKYLKFEVSCSMYMHPPNSSWGDFEIVQVYKTKYKPNKLPVPPKFLFYILSIVSICCKGCCYSSYPWGLWNTTAGHVCNTEPDSRNHLTGVVV